MARLSLLSTPAPEILNALKTSRFRARFHLSNELRTYAQRLGKDLIKVHARDIFSARIAPAAKANDGKQTPMKGHPIFIAQHACALCCRGCMQKWYGISSDRPLTEDEISQAVELATAWIAEDLNRPAKPIKKVATQTRQASFDF